MDPVSKILGSKILGLRKDKYSKNLQLYTGEVTSATGGSALHQPNLNPSVSNLSKKYHVPEEYARQMVDRTNSMSFLSDIEAQRYLEKQLARGR